MTIGSDGAQQPATKGEEFDQLVIDTADNPSALVTSESGGVAVKADAGNDGIVYVGWDDSVDAATGFPLAAGDGITLDLDTSQQAVWVHGDTNTDIVAYITTN